MNRLLPVLILVLALPAHAEIFKWVDERGRTHFGEAPPEKYRKSAAPVATQPVNTIDGRILGKPSGRAAATSGPGETPAPVAPPALSDQERCASEHARFSASQSCFARYRNANGSLRAEASNNCENIPQPTCELQR